ncbi:MULTISPECIES: DUF2336 domain-containing protein [unclassified Bradyrhizobium]|uniref:DUF2336 domain-containing protein n=1 Tax=unclassified Bradyrhizobium TaxID=2631580 RepID=UPI001FFA085C|nr:MULTISPECIES: DUF2336 domain-containing protein [unclassified Bradyrhizobium]MCK1268695.1 DUF2336 domain-containing protein [Bradyrhizobium sp. 84]MCK1309474.1 DUF2336 domain-containing protein [Bradyrhizobium sp. 45]MCK1370873.1 DUF2336 domain-containing protein [Bradyrhizobium sp. 49]MCK1484361.1 DUF2336 domain-containing protein [Bradyrhizobium sp. 193]MCK1496230.1 DUF2336 domain-containing protein [Bradyrhizobium sp. 188]
MTGIAAADVIVELDATIAGSSSERCVRILRRIVELLVAGNGRLQEPHIDLLDELLVRLIAPMAPSTLVELSTALADLRAAPKKTLRRLASCEDAAIAVPVLRQSPALSPWDLMDIAGSSSERHLLAIADRREIENVVTDVLLQRGSSKVCLALIGNPAAGFSDAGYSILIGKAEQDDEITKALALRPGTPDMVVRALLSASPRPATGTNAEARPCAFSGAATSSEMPVTVKRPRDAEYAAARPEIVLLNRGGKLNDSTVNRFVIRSETANLYTALSVLSGAPVEVVEHVMAEPDCEGLVMACRASRLNWQTTLAILNSRGPRLSFGERERAQELFEKLHLSTSQWSVRWGEISAGADDRTAKSRASR